MQSGTWHEVVEGRMGMADLVSIIVPVYQSEQYLRRCVDSLLNQTYGRLEVILVDDGSTDSSLDICREYESRDSRIKVLHQENQGVACARNAGLRAMSGDYFLLIDGDDYIHPSMVAELLAVIHLGEADMAICGFRMVYEDGSPEERHSIEEYFLGTLDEFLEQQMLSLYDRLLINTQSNKLYSGRLQRKHKIFYDESMAINEDTCFSMRMLRRSKRIACTPGDYLNYWQRPSSLVTRFNENGVDTCFPLLEAVDACLKKGHASPELMNEMNNRMLFNICGFAGLPYYRSSWSLGRCYREIRKLAGRPRFRKLLKETKAVGTKNKVAAFALRYRLCLLYHGMCLYLYRTQRKQYKRNNHE